MNELFASRVYPTMLYVLDLVERIRQRKTPEPTPQEEFPRLKQFLGQLDSSGLDQKDFELAKAALVYWIDELLVNSNWSYANEWKNNTLERDLYDARDRAWEFFEKAKTAKSLSRPDALETYYLCVALGFLGIYREGENKEAPARSATLPPPTPLRQPNARGESISWFSERIPVGGEQETWGFSEAFKPAEAGAAGRAEVGPGRGPTGAVRDLPRTLAEWAAPVYAQIMPRSIRAFLPTVPCESQRDARPLRGLRVLKRSLALLFWISAVAVVLILVKLWNS